MMTSDTSFGPTRARRSASAIATSPSLWAGRLASPPLNDPTGVRAALAMTIQGCHWEPPGPLSARPEGRLRDQAISSRVAERVIVFHSLAQAVAALTAAAKAGRPLVRLIPIRAEKPVLGSARGLVTMTPGWDDPMTPEEMEEFFGR